MPEHVHSSRLYWMIYVVLMLLLVATIGLSFVDFGREISNSVAMVIAIAKGLLIILFFMHVRWRRPLTWCFAAAGFLWLCIMLTLTATDYVTRNHPINDCPKGEPVFLTLH